ncbi:Gasdermin-E [Labeo rohita]|uniref:Gasdermin-E n=1 Tax=Labeo rohita TaxID=84645 RepID=A0ABQ8LXV9_LABRO|nr:Gasdermin-E [Labeo rohita]
MGWLQLIGEEFAETGKRSRDCLHFYLWTKTLRKCLWQLPSLNSGLISTGLSTLEEPRFDSTAHPSRAFLFQILLLLIRFVSDVDAVWTLICVGLLTTIEDDVFLQIFSALTLCLLPSLFRRMKNSSSGNEPMKRAGGGAKQTPVNSLGFCVAVVDVFNHKRREQTTMFAKATKNLLSEIDTDGSLIPVSRLNDSDGLAPLAVVIKRNRYWFWQWPKYLPADFMLNDVLVGDPIEPAVAETDFLTYNGKVVDNRSGSAAADLGVGTINVGGAGSSKLQTSFGNLQKQEVDIQKLLKASKSRGGVYASTTPRVLDLNHSLIEQTRETKREVLTLVKERIITTQSCTITEEVQGGGTCAGIFGFNKTIKGHVFGPACRLLSSKYKLSHLSLVSPQVSVNNKEKPFVESDTNVSINIPPKTTLAYSVIELDVSNTGHYELCLLPNVKGGFEVDGIVKLKEANTLSAAPRQTTSKLQKDLEALQGQFTVLSKLPSSTRSSLFQKISQLLQNSIAINVLEDALEDLCGGTQPDQTKLDKMPALKSTIEVVQKAAGKDCSGKQVKPSPLTAMHLLISSLDGDPKARISAISPDGCLLSYTCCQIDLCSHKQSCVHVEMTDSALSDLKSCCTYPILQALLHLVQNMTLNKKSLLKDTTVLTNEKVFKKTTSLFASCNVILIKEKDSLVTKINSSDDNLPLMLCVAVKCLASLAPPA